jgi:hypothetical protein
MLRLQRAYLESKAQACGIASTGRARLRREWRKEPVPQSNRAGVSLAPLWLIALIVFATNAMAQLSVPSAQFHGRAAKKSAAFEEMRSPRDAASRTILLSPPTAAEYATLRSTVAGANQHAKPSKSRGLAVGFPRGVPAPDNAMPLADLPWQTLPDGARTARIELTSPGAVAIRIQVGIDNLSDGLMLRFKGSASGAPIFAYPAAAIVRAGAFWTPVLEGASATIELELAAGSKPSDAVLALPMISHLGAPGTSLKTLSSYIGQSEACEVDVACIAPALQQQMASATNSVARMIATVSGVTYLCSGTLLNDSRGSFTPYFLSANHCLTGVNDTTGSGSVAASAATTVNTYWFFQALTCGSQAVPGYTLIADGATLLARGVDYDWSLVRLNGSPPSGATFAAWNATGPLTAGVSVAAIHHPEGDLKKITQGNTFGYSFYPDGSSFIQAQWTSGATEAGSSGGGLFALNPANGTLELRGSLAGGSATCGAPQGIDEFSRFDVAFPLVQQYLAPDAPNPVRTAPVTEFYSASSDEYLITADPTETSALDNGAPQGWMRTGLRFLAFTDPTVAPMAVQPVCRFRLAPAIGDARFYSASPQECADLTRSFGNAWALENAAAFYVALPDATTGTCPANTRAVYRFAKTGNTAQRRYTAEVDVRDSIIRRGGWTQEGFGPAPNQVAMCAPTAGPTTIGLSLAPPSYEGLWWAAPPGSESGWGLSVAQQGEILFVGWFTYDDRGKPSWLSMTANKTGPNSYSGLLIQTSGPPFNAVPFDPNEVTLTPIGAATLTFRDDANGTFSYAVAGSAQSKSITRFAFGPLPTCTYETQPDFSAAMNYQDVWFVPGGAESGWGLMLTHEGDGVFVAWFTYDANRQPLWLSAIAWKVGPGQYAGTLIRTTGPPFNAVPFDPAKVTRDAVGTVTLTFASGNQATFSYSLGGVVQSKPITRLLFAPPAGTLCR